MQGDMLKTLPKVMALVSKLKGLEAVAVAGEEETMQALDKLEEVCWNDGARSLLLTATVDGDLVIGLVVGGEKAAALLASLG